jgi:nucleoside-diphosphate-sugar epimerase
MASTMETYGHQDHWIPFTEATPQYPAAPYAVAKVACEKYLDYMDYAYGFPYTILRQTNTYGRSDNDFFVVERILTQMLAGGPVRLGDPDPYRNFLHIDDLVALYRRVVEDRPIGETFVTGPNNALQIDDLAELCRKVTGYAGDIEWHTIPKRPGEIYFLSSSPVKARVDSEGRARRGSIADGRPVAIETTLPDAYGGASDGLTTEWLKRVSRDRHSRHSVIVHLGSLEGCPSHTIAEIAAKWRS